MGISIEWRSYEVDAPDSSHNNPPISIARLRPGQIVDVQYDDLGEPITTVVMGRLDGVVTIERPNGKEFVIFSKDGEVFDQYDDEGRDTTPKIEFRDSISKRTARIVYTPDFPTM